MSVAYMAHSVAMSADELQAYTRLPVDELVRAISATRDREIVLLDSNFSGMQSQLCGLWLGLPQNDLIFISDDLSGIHRDHVILHELAHLLLDHRAVDGATIEEIASLFPSLSAGLIARVLQRSYYDNEQEREAEELASAIAARTRGSRRSVWVNSAANRRAAEILGQI